MTFAIFSGSTLIGTSKLEHGDAPMGVAFGRFYPNEGYAAIRNECIENVDDQTGLGLSVTTSEGVSIECAGVGILDASLAALEEIEVNVFGILNPPYEVLFADHVARYENQTNGTAGK